MTPKVTPLIARTNDKAADKNAIAGKVSAFVAAVGTGGTLAGVSVYLKEQNQNIEIACADP